MHCEERSLRGDVIAKDAAVGRTVVEFRDGSVAFLSGGVLSNFKVIRTALVGIDEEMIYSPISIEMP